MKTPEILLASAVIAAVAGAAAAFAARAFEAESPRRAEEGARSVGAAAPSDAADPAPVQRALDDLRMENAALRERLAALEARLDADPVRVPVETASAADEPAAQRQGDYPPAEDGIELSPAFVASVGRALETIEAREDEDREQRRKELQAQRIEERVVRLQTELGLTNRQASDMRTTLLAMDEKREELFTSLRDGDVDPREVRDSFRSLREEMDQRLSGFLTAEQLESYNRQEQDFRRGFDFGGGPPDGGPGREGFDAARRGQGERRGGG